MASWQSHIINFPNIMVHLMETQKLSDVSFTVGNPPNQKTLKTHKFLLAIRSDVFEEMFSGASGDSDEIVVPDIEPDIFEILLRYIYTEKLTARNVEEAIQTCYAAYKYNITHLMHLCYTYTERELCAENVCAIYEMTLVLNNNKLQSKCEDKIIEETKEVFESETFLQVTFETIKSVYSHTFSFTINNELFLFEQLLKWAEAELERREEEVNPGTIRELIDPILPQIRFLDMTYEEFVRGPGISGTLSDEEIAKIGMNISVPDCVPLPEWCHKERSEPA